MVDAGQRATLRRPAREVPVVADVDVLIVGGGAAGIAAGIAAARAGARTLLVERYGAVGGMATGGLIILLLTLDDGAGRQVVAGVCQELVERLRARGAAVAPPAAEWGCADEALIDQYQRWGLVWGQAPHRVRYSVAYDPEEFRFVANEMLREAGVRLRLHTWAAEPVVEGDRIAAIVVHSKAGTEAIRARVVVDASGDGDVFAAAGELFAQERVHPWLWFRMANVRDVDAAIDAARGRFFPTLGGLFFKTLGPGRALMPWGIADALDRKINPVDPDDLTYAELECRRLVMQVADRLKAEVPGFEQAYLDDLATQLGIYESRRLEGQYILTREDADKPFPDSVARTGNWVRYGQVFNIPYRCLLPRRVANLLAAGRCISVDHRVHQATKEIPACMATGQAAGVAAALAAASPDAAVGAVDVAELRRMLLTQGASL
ncbi:MAG: FAD-dependent oxidoreductase [Chloroflexi bacterium]|nr:FAD-dependent oxidoreductase [Chloroflexota bacterium]